MKLQSDLKNGDLYPSYAAVVLMLCLTFLVGWWAFTSHRKANALQVKVHRLSELNAERERLTTLLKPYLESRLENEIKWRQSLLNGEIEDITLTPQQKADYADHIARADSLLKRSRRGEDVSGLIMKFLPDEETDVLFTNNSTGASSDNTPDVLGVSPDQN